jgi:hypothetical protein
MVTQSPSKLEAITKKGGKALDSAAAAPKSGKAAATAVKLAASLAQSDGQARKLEVRASQQPVVAFLSR